jgi:hypothetical protein
VRHSAVKRNTRELEVGKRLSSLNDNTEETAEFRCSHDSGQLEGVVLVH